MKQKLKGHFYLIISTLIISASYIFVEEIKDVSNPLFLVFYRFLFASLILFAWVLIFKRKELVNLTNLFLKTSIVGFFYAAFFVLQIYAQQQTSILNVSSILTLVPFLTALFMFAFLKVKLNFRQVIIYAFAMITTLWVVFNGDINAILSFKLNFGDLIAFAGAISLVLYIISMKLVHKGEDAIILVFASLINGTIFLTLFMLLFGYEFEFSQIDTKAFLCISYLIIFSTIISMFLFQKATILVGAISVSSYTYLTPSFVLILACILYGNLPSISVIVAVICSCFATFLIQTKYFQQTDTRIS